MVFMEAAWLRPWGIVKGQESPKMKLEQPFEAADAMERGVVGLPSTAEETRLLLAPGQAQTLKVRCSPNALEHKLFEESGKLLLTSRARPEDSRIDIFLASERIDGAPSFTLVFDEDHSDFKLMWLSNDSPRDALRSPSQELVRVLLSREEVGDGAYMYLDVTVHEVGRGSVVRLGSKRPQWNKRLRSLTLDFHGRCDHASPRNIQLVLPDKDEDEDSNNTSGKSGKSAAAESVMLFGKTGNGAFVLDYESPLGAMQAFAVALATTFWN